MSPPPQRIASIDCLRGFDMIWILGLEAGLRGILARFFPDNAAAQIVSSQLTHVPWDGFHFYDLIFPLFIFLSGLSLALSLSRRAGSEPPGVTARRLIQRGLLLFLLGVFFNAGLRDGLENVRWLGVLQRIAISTSIAGLLSLVLRPRALMLTALGLLAGYGALLLWVPVPGTGYLGFEEGKNLANWLDSAVLPGRKHNGTHDPEGLLSSLPAIVTALSGYLTGIWIQKTPTAARLKPLLLAGLLCVAAGWTFSPWIPVIKKLWSPTFVLITTGWSLLLLAVFGRLFDDKPAPVWSSPLYWVGSNPIILYLLSGLGLFRSIAERVVGKSDQPLGWLLPFASVTVMLALARWMYRRQCFVRV
jgi:predicted acyltransferase